MSEQEEQKTVQVPTAPKPPGVTQLVVERMRMLEDSLTELTAMVRVSRTYNNVEMTEIRSQGAQISRAFLYIAMVLPIIAFLLGGILVAVLIR